MESPIRTSACMSFPFGAAERLSSTAPNARFKKSIYPAAPCFTVSCGVTVWNPSGTALVAIGTIHGNVRPTLWTRSGHHKTITTRIRPERIRGAMYSRSKAHLSVLIWAKPRNSRIQNGLRTTGCHDMAYCILRRVWPQHSASSERDRISRDIHQ
jgi:hypothetical protein